MNSASPRRREHAAFGIRLRSATLALVCATGSWVLGEKKKPRRRGASNWSGRRESNPRLLLGRQGHYHYATPALDRVLSEAAARVPCGHAPPACLLVGRAGFEPAYRLREPGLQPGAINHSTTDPRCGPALIRGLRGAFLSPKRGVAASAARTWRRRRRALAVDGIGFVSLLRKHTVGSNPTVGSASFSRARVIVVERERTDRS